MIAFPYTGPCSININQRLKSSKKCGEEARAEFVYRKNVLYLRLALLSLFTNYEKKVLASAILHIWCLFYGR